MTFDDAVALASTNKSFSSCRSSQRCMLLMMVVVLDKASVVVEEEVTISGVEATPDVVDDSTVVVEGTMYNADDGAIDDEVSVAEEEDTPDVVDNGDIVDIGAEDTIVDVEDCAVVIEASVTVFFEDSRDVS